MKTLLTLALSLISFQSMASGYHLQCNAASGIVIYVDNTFGSAQRYEIVRQEVLMFKGVARFTDHQDGTISFTSPAGDLILNIDKNTLKGTFTEYRGGRAYRASCVNGRDI